MMFLPEFSWYYSWFDILFLLNMYLDDMYHFGKNSLSLSLPLLSPSLFWISFIGMLRLCNISYGPCAFSLQYSSFHLYLLQFEYSLFISLLVQQSSLGLCLILVNLLIFESSCIFIYMISLCFYLQYFIFLLKFPVLWLIPWTH